MLALVNPLTTKVCAENIWGNVRFRLRIQPVSATPLDRGATQNLGNVASGPTTAYKFNNRVALERRVIAVNEEAVGHIPLAPRLGRVNGDRERADRSSG